jgi:hypothetical protein
VFSGQANTPISKVSASGGTVTPVTTLAEGILTQYWPQFLPDGQHILYYQGGAKPELQGTFVTTLDSAPGRRVLNTSSRAVYGAGHLLFVREGILFAQPFDDRALTTTGDAVRIADDVGYYATAFAYTAVTAAATSVLAHGPNVVLATSLQWRDRSGANIGVPLAPRAYSSPRLSPDQTTVVVSITDVPTAQSDLWQVALARGTISRVTTDPLGDMFPTWSPDGSRVYFSSPRVGTQTIFQKVGNAPEEVLADDGLLTSVATYATDVTSDGRFLLYQQSTSRGYNLGVLSMAERKPSPFAEGAFNEVQGRFSPNGRWVAYASDESGKFDVYVRPFPADRSQSTMISIAGGMQPEWRRDGKELFYISADGKMTAVPVVTDGPVFTAGAPRALFDVATPESTAPYPSNYAVTADGQRFLINTTVEQPTRPALAVIFNWLSSLNK